MSKSLLKYMNKKVAIVGIAIIFLILAIVAISNLNDQQTQSQVQFYSQEAVLAQAYNPSVRNALFNLVVDEEKYEYGAALGSELYRSMLVMSTRSLARQKDMSDEWKDWFINDIDSLSRMILNRHYTVLNNDLFNFISIKPPTNAEKEIIKEISKIWSEADDYSEQQLLSEVSYSLDHSEDGTHYTKVSEGKIPSADLIANHLMMLAKDLAKVPRTALHFFYDIDNFSEFIIHDFRKSNNNIVDNKKNATELVNFFREFKYQKISEQDVISKEVLYEIQYSQSGRSRNIKIYDGYIEVDGLFGNYYVYPPIVWKNIEGRYGNVKEEDWRYLGDEFGNFPSIDGFYKINGDFGDKFIEFVEHSNIIE